MINTLNDKSFEWIQMKLLNPATLGWVAVAIGATLIIHSSLKLRRKI
jgi:hypothetical protein